MSGIQRALIGLSWGLCAISVVALYASAARQFARISNDTVQHWVDGTGAGYAVIYAPMHGL